MSEKSKKSGPPPAHAEEFDEETQEAVPGTRQSASKTRHTAAQGSSGSSKLFGMVSLKKAKSTKSTKSTKSPEKVASKKSSSRSAKQPDLKIDTNVESQQQAARMSLSGDAPPPARRMSTSHSTRVDATGIHHTIPIRISQQGRRPSMSRPTSVYGSLPGQQFPLVYTSAPVISPPFIPAPPPPQQPIYQHPQQPAAYIMPTPTSPGRSTAYPFPATLPPQYIAPTQQSPWEAPYSHYPPPSAPGPAISRRYSMAGHSPPIIDYSIVPHRPAIQPVYEHSRPPSAYHVQYGTHGVDERAMVMSEYEAYHQQRRSEERAAMPPPPVPQRPLLKHIVTAPQPIRRSNRTSLESIPRRSASSRHESFSSQREEIKAPLMDRSSSSRNGVSRTIPPSPESPRKSRPGSYHAGVESSRRQSLTTEAVRRVESATKSTKPKTSEAGSRTSRKISEPKKRPESHHKVSGEAVHVEVDPGCAATVTRDATGYSVRVRTTEDQTTRAGRQTEREDADNRRYSVSSRRESSGLLEGLARPTTTRRPSSTHPTTRRPRLEQVVPESVTRRITDYKIRDYDETAVEDDDDFSEPETPRKRSEKLTARSVQRLKKSSEARQGSKDSASVKSSRSARSTNSSRRGTRRDGEFF